MPTPPLFALGLVFTCCLMTGCEAKPQATPEPAVPASSPTQVSQSTTSLDQVASVPVIDTQAPATMTMVTSVSSTVAVPVYITAGQQPEADAVAKVGHIGHSAEAIAFTNTMIEAISQAIRASNADVAFVKSMIAHHEGAIALAQIELKYGKNDALRKLAQDIIIMRSNEIRWMDSWLDNHTDIAQQIASASAPTALQQEPDYTDGLKEMYTQMLDGIHQNNPDIAFAQTMIPHHKGALAMAQIEFKYGNDDKIRELADSIIDSQQGEILFLQQWLKTQPAPTQ